MRIIDEVRSLFRGRPLTEEELAARAEAEHAREQGRLEAAELVARDNSQRGSI